MSFDKTLSYQQINKTQQMHLENSAKIAYKKLKILIRFFAWVRRAFGIFWSKT